MPRDGSNIYHRPPGTDGIPNTTVASTPYNAYTADVEQDLNLPRPIVAGGTGATTANQAMLNLSGEIAKQQVTNYDSFPFVAGSFYSNPGATSAPDSSHYFVGSVLDLNGNSMVIIAYVGGSTGVPSRAYTRTKSFADGTWGPWVLQASVATDFVAKAGDQMSGNLTIATPANSTLLLASAPGNYNILRGQKNNLSRWEMYLGMGDAESGSNAGSSFGLVAINDAGSAAVGTALSISRANLSATFGGAITASGAIIGSQLAATAPAITSGSGGATGTYYFGNSGTKVLNYDGASFNFVGGQLNVVAGSLQIGSGGSTAILYMGNTGTKYLQFDGTNYNLVGGNNLNVSGFITATQELYVGYGSGGGVIRFGTAAHSLNYDGANFNFVGGGLIAMPYFFVLGGTQRAKIDHNGGSWNFFSDGSGSVGQYMLPGGSAWVAFSDARQLYKVNAKQIDNVLNRLAGVNLYTNIGPSGEKEVFFKAQELALTLPELVAEGKGARARDAAYVPTGPGDENGWGVMYDRTSCVALQAVKELLARVEALESELAKAKS
jgi:hypothetical protein